MDRNQGNKVILKKFQPKWTAQATSWYPAIGQTLPGTSSGESLSNGRGFLPTKWLEFMKTTCALGFST